MCTSTFNFGYLWEDYPTVPTKWPVVVAFGQKIRAFYFYLSNVLIIVNQAEEVLHD